MIVAIVIIAATFLVVVGMLLAYWPKGISVNENGQIQLSTYLGKTRLIPVDDISVTEVPEGLLSHLIRTNGMSLGKPSDQDQRHEPWQNQLWPLQEHKNRAEDVPLSHRQGKQSLLYLQWGLICHR